MAIPVIFNRYKKSIGRVQDFTGPKPLLRGTCFLVSPRFALTCHHVVHTTKGQIQKLEVRFEGHPRQTYPATIFLTDEALDISVLELGTEVQLPPLTVSSHDAWGEPFFTFGYPLDHGGAGVSEDGEIFGPSSTASGAARLELRANRIRRGFSGGPVFVVTSDTAGYCIGCISDTGSENYPDRPACTPLSSFFEQYPQAKDLFSTIIAPPIGDLQSTLVNLSEQSEPASLWKVTRQIVNKNELAGQISSEGLDIAAVANKVYETVRENLAASARQADEAKVRQLSVIVTGLRAKYQQLHIDLPSLYQAAQTLQKPMSDEDAHAPYPPLLTEAEIVSDDLKRVPPELLGFAKTHGAESTLECLKGIAISGSIT